MTVLCSEDKFMCFSSLACLRVLPLMRRDSTTYAHTSRSVAPPGVGAVAYCCSASMVQCFIDPALTPVMTAEPYIVEVAYGLRRQALFGLTLCQMLHSLSLR